MPEPAAVGTRSYERLFRRTVSPKLKLPKLKKIDAEALEQLPWVTFHRQNAKPIRDSFKLSVEGKEYAITPKNIAAYRANNLTAIKTIIQQGHGIGFLPRFIFEKDIKEGTLKEFSPKMEWLTGTELFLVYPSKSFIPPKTKVLSDWIISKARLEK